MAKKIIWSIKAQNDRINIFTYWNNRNKSNTYSKKLNQLFIESIKILALHPNIGKQTDVNNVRIKIVRDYFIIYEIINNHLMILTIWDSRQSPKAIGYNFQHH